MHQRRQFTAEFKARVVLKVLSGQKTAAQVCHEQQFTSDLLSRWKADFVRQAPLLFQGNGRLVGRLTVEFSSGKKAAVLSTGNRNGKPSWS